jgi:hypothetical protein
MSLILFSDLPKCRYSQVLKQINYTLKEKDMKHFKLLVIALALIIGLFAGCKKDAGPTTDNTDLCPPANVNITVIGRAMTVTWDAADNASGYEIVTTSVGCGSGNRTINTKENTAVVTSSGNAASNVSIGQTSLKITLMAASGNPDAAMASAVTAKVKSLGGTITEKTYVDSDYSEIVSKTIEK